MQINLQMKRKRFIFVLSMQLSKDIKTSQNENIRSSNQNSNR